jgi:hypothetical protein
MFYAVGVFHQQHCAIVDVFTKTLIREICTPISLLCQALRKFTPLLVFFTNNTKSQTEKKLTPIR